MLAYIANGMKADAGIKKTQMSFKERLRRHGKKAAEAALMTEFTQLEERIRGRCKRPFPIKGTTMGRAQSD